FSRTLRWSYGAMKGRETDAWQAAVAARPLLELVPAVAQAGFDGLYVDRAGYEDGADQVERTLTRLLATPPLRSDDGRFLFFSLVDYKQGSQGGVPCRPLHRNSLHPRPEQPADPAS